MGSPFEQAPPIGQVRCKIKDFPLSSGRFKVIVRMLVNGIEADWPREPIGSIIVEQGDFYKTGRFDNDGRTVMMIKGEWSLTY
jgi:hypothetical protein